MSTKLITGSQLKSVVEAIKNKLDLKQDQLTAGTGISIAIDPGTNKLTISSTLDTDVFAILTTLPEANAANYELYKNKIVIVPNDSTSGNNYDEYLIIRSGSAGSYTYSWEEFGKFHAEIELAWDAITNKPTTISGYGITDAKITGTGDNNKTITLGSQTITPITSVTKAQVEAVLTGNITTHTHDQYVTSVSYNTANKNLVITKNVNGSDTTTTIDVTQFIEVIDQAELNTIIAVLG